MSEPADRTCDVLVVGGGITGCATALSLAQLGADVLLLDGFDLNTQASGRNAGSLHGQIQHPSFVDRGEGWARGFLPSLVFLQESLAMWAVLEEEVGDLEVLISGGLLVASSPGQMRQIEQKVAIEREAGVESEILDAADLRRIAPYLSESIVGAQLCPSEGKANPLLAAPALASKAKSLGARIEPNSTVIDLRQLGKGFTAITSRGAVRASRVVLAAGNGINRFSELWGNPLPITDEPVQVSATEPVAPLIKHLLYFAGGPLTAKQARAGSVLIGGGWAASLDSAGRPRVDPDNLARNMQVALRVVPQLSDLRVIRSWAGIGLATPDLAPIIDRLCEGRLVLGVYPHMGLTAGPLMGRVMAQLVLEIEPDVDVRPFGLDRF